MSAQQKRSAPGRSPAGGELLVGADASTQPCKGVYCLPLEVKVGQEVCIAELGQLARCFALPDKTQGCAGTGQVSSKPKFPLERT